MVAAADDGIPTSVAWSASRSARSQSPISYAVVTAIARASTPKTDHSSPARLASARVRSNAARAASWSPWR